MREEAFFMHFIRKFTKRTLPVDLYADRSVNCNSHLFGQFWDCPVFMLKKHL